MIQANGTLAVTSSSPSRSISDLLALDAGEHALEALAVLGQPVELELGLEAVVGLEVLQPGQRPVDAGRGDLEPVFARDRIGGVQHLGDRAGQAGAVLDVHVAVGGPLGHDLQGAAGLGAAHQPQADDLVADGLGDGVEQLQQLAVFRRLGPQRPGLP